MSSDGDELIKRVNRIEAWIGSRTPDCPACSPGMMTPFTQDSPASGCYGATGDTAWRCTMCGMLLDKDYRSKGPYTGRGNCWREP